MGSIEESQKCRYNYLGNSGLRVSNICLGALTFGKSQPELDFPGQLDEAGSHQMINRFVEWGGNFFDTANFYGVGNSERVIGSWLTGQDRDRFVIATKVFFPMDPTNPNTQGLSRRNLIQSVEGSLERLQTNYIDLYQTHAWSQRVPSEETMRTLDDLVRCGKVHYLGANNLSGWQLQKLVDLTDRMGWNPFISLQQQYSLVCRGSELEPFQVCSQNGIGVLPWSPLKGGFLTDKIMQQKMEGRLGKAAQNELWGQQSFHPWSEINTERNRAILQAVDTVAKARGKSIAQVSIRWLLQKPIVSSVIIGATKMHQLEDNMAAANGWQLTPDEMQELDDASKTVVFYPYDYISWADQVDYKNFK